MSATSVQQLRLALKFARRELRGGLKGFRVFFLCLLLGAGAISGVETLSSAFLGSLRDQGQTILGGDISASVVHQPIDARAQQFLAARGTVSKSATMRAMAYALRDGNIGERQLVELKAVDSRWPLFGAPRLNPVQKLSDVLACEEDQVCGAAAEQSFLDRLRLQRGDLFRVGNATFRLMAVLEHEPDRISTGFSLGPRLLILTEALPRTGLVTPESLVNWTYRVKLNQGQTIEGFRNAADTLEPDPNWRLRDSGDAAPGIRRFVEQVAMFLTLIGLTALCVGGAGAGHAILAFLDRKRFDIAILKSLGGEGEFVFRIFLVQVMGVALGATVLGAAIGTSVPFLVVWRYGNSLPVPPEFGLYPSAILLALAFGLLSALAFSIPPLGRSRGIRPASLLRDMVAPSEDKDADIAVTRSRKRDWLLAGGAVAAIVALALVTAPRPVFAAQFLGGGIAVIVALRLAAAGMMGALRAIPRPRSSLIRMALANLVRPGAATGGTITALGLGLTLLATVTLLGSAVKASIRNELPGRAPSFYFVDIQKSDGEAFDQVIRSFSTQTEYLRTPMIRGRIVGLGGVSAGRARVADSARWALNGDRGITYAGAQPPDTVVTKGEWWPADYNGPTLISLDESIATGAELEIGDTMVLNVLGREIEGKIHNLRKVNFRNGRQNFVLILSPGVIDKAPHAFLATVRVSPEQENGVYRAITDRFPSVSTVRVRDSIAQLEVFIAQISEGISAASLLTILAGLLVLAGAITAGTRTRVYDATILKVQGATRSRIAAIHAIEFAILGLVTGAMALVAGTAGAWAICHFILDIGFVFDAAAAAATVAGGAAAVLLFGLLGAVAALGVKPARILRSA
ncbi:MAG TPA: FtsX-like permease family protein [Rhizomicrobium sp.]|nr:FtsX-like permease family protein [Rhizomicrobium sp.]